MHTLPELPYAYNALEPYYDEQTVKLHHDIHHKAYVDGLNNAEAKLQAARDAGDMGLVKHWSRELGFHGSGHFLHSIFWTNMKPGGGGAPTGAAADYINKAFGSHDKFKAQFLAASNTVEGSGWGLLVYRRDTDSLEILATEKHQDQSQWGSIVLIALDCWEHAYYLKYQNKRIEWTKTFMEHLINWDNVNERLARAKASV
ncbi:MAG: Superoxide dismutase [Mn/Fe] [Myxococcota bacterium]|nr:Superoxide dismutase [Mn/Fe] [Myxococcota bacterium]